MNRDDVVGVGGSRARGGVLVPSASAVTLLFLNLLDGLFTLAFLQLGYAEEANPLMRAVYDASPVSFMLVKLAIVSAGVLLLAVYSASRLARLAQKLALAVYAVIVTWHLAFVAHLLVG
jgi:hypothetical protein